MARNFYEILFSKVYYVVLRGILMGEAGDICRDCNRYANSISMGKMSHERPSLLLEAAPRFELGIRVLQTPALPLGHAALKVP